jgi:hypothetical protein
MLSVLIQTLFSLNPNSKISLFQLKIKLKFCNHDSAEYIMVRGVSCGEQKLDFVYFVLIYECVFMGLHISVSLPNHF